jgi:transposase
MTVCHRCGYEWEYTGELIKATCPSCGVKTDADADADE